MESSRGGGWGARTLHALPQPCRAQRPALSRPAAGSAAPPRPPFMADSMANAGPKHGRSGKQGRGRGRGRARRSRSPTAAEREPQEIRAAAFPRVQLPAGPRTKEELTNWEKQNFEALLASKPSLLRRLEPLLKRGLQLYSDYSGIDGQREGLYRQIDYILQMRPEWALNVDHCLQHCRTCDYGKLQTSVACRREAQKRGDDTKECHFINILDRLPTSAREYVEASLPEPKTTKAERSYAHRALFEWFKQNQDWIFQDAAARVPCAVHDGHCPLHPAANFGWKKEALTDRPIYINTAGMCCQGYSAALS